MRWTVDKELIAEPGGGWDVEVVHALHLTRGGTEKRLLRVGYDVGAPRVMARVAAQPYLDDDDPPKRLLVGRDGQISVIE